jgi:hypothetical protein
MIEKITNWFIRRDLRKRHIHVNPSDKTQSAEFRRVLNTLRENKIMVVTKDDGIYIRLAGDQNKGQSFSSEFVKVKSF